MKGNSAGHNSKYHYHRDYCPIEKGRYSIRIVYHKFPVHENGKVIYMKTKNYDCVIRNDDKNCTFKSIEECPIYISAPSSLNESEL